jgi:23S rRNA G2069 N7-methylase RlmK/C1962 C5-methylase RlmI
MRANRFSAQMWRDHIKIARALLRRSQDGVMIVIPQALRNIPPDLFACQLMQDFLLRQLNVQDFNSRCDDVWS